MEHLFPLALVALLLGSPTPVPAPAHMAPLFWLQEWAIQYPHARTGPLASPEAGEEREERLGRVALGAWRAAAQRSDLGPLVTSDFEGAKPQAGVALALLVLTAGESGAWDLRIHAGLPHPLADWHQDHGRARCLAQLHASRWYPKTVWQQLAGTDQEATDRCMAAALRILECHMQRCGVGYTEGGLAVAYAAYGRGNGCTTSEESLRRARQWAVALPKLRQRALR